MKTEGLEKPDWMLLTEAGWVEEGTLRRTIQKDGERNPLGATDMKLMCQTFNEGEDWKSIRRTVYWSPEGAIKIRRHWKGVREQWTQVKLVRECPNKNIMLGKVQLKSGILLPALVKIKVQRDKYSIKGLRLIWCVRLDEGMWEVRAGRPPNGAKFWNGK